MGSAGSSLMLPNPIRTSSRCDGRDRRKVWSISAFIAFQDLTVGHCRVGADEGIREHPGSGPATSSIAGESLGCQIQRGAGDIREAQPARSALNAVPMPRCGRDDLERCVYLWAGGLHGYSEYFGELVSVMRDCSKGSGAMDRDSTV